MLRESPIQTVGPPDTTHGEAPKCVPAPNSVEPRSYEPRERDRD